MRLNGYQGYRRGILLHRNLDGTPNPGYERLPYFPPDEHLRRERDHIYEWNISQEVQPGLFILNDFDFERPKANLEVKAIITREHARAKMEVFDYPGEYIQTGDGDGRCP